MDWERGSGGEEGGGWNDCGGGRLVEEEGGKLRDPSFSLIHFSVYLNKS